MIASPASSVSQATVVALHCSLGSGRHWTALAEALDGRYRLLAPDLSGYGDKLGARRLPTTLAQEAALLSDTLAQADGPFHLIGHSYGGAVAFSIATASPHAGRVRSLTLIEPVLPTLLRENKADSRLFDRFAALGHDITTDLWKGSAMEAIDKFTTYWNGSGPPLRLSEAARLRAIAHADKLAFDFAAIVAEHRIAERAAAIRIPTLLFSGGLSPYMTQRVTARLASLIPGADARHLPAAGHMLPLSHAAILNPAILQHLAGADKIGAGKLAAGKFAADEPVPVSAALTPEAAS